MRASRVFENIWRVGDWNPELYVAPGKEKVAGHDADDLVRRTAEDDRLADDARITREGTAPEVVAEDHDARFSGEGFFVRERTAHLRRDAEDTEEITGY